MNMKKAISIAKQMGNWNIVSGSPTSIAVRFWHTDQTQTALPDETELDLYGPDLEQEAVGLWESLAEEMGSSTNLIACVSAYGYIAGREA